ncbi:hypothetical protein IM816_10095 [Luteibacter flocculans]|uniref:Uncharacterized protein n=1 Tax=Luteibacter flocculans TaxID=2780091 RepID=A0ABY4T172_9GAMM|nr:hypothetical protein [Luteibacter flocculans]URL57015.1 hypothetical protein IM816_10095 [Luteibacter flocculans]
MWDVEEPGSPDGHLTCATHHYGIPAWCGDPDNPPEFETQRAYLKRHGLLLPEERRKIDEPFLHPLRIEAATKWK